jgi:long-chain-alcohol oxidase
MEGRMHGHPLLRGKRREKKEYNHGLSEREMQALSAMCGAVIPSVPIEKIHEATGSRGPPSKTVETFYLASASEFPVPDEVHPLSLLHLVDTLICIRTHLMFINDSNI